MSTEAAMIRDLKDLLDAIPGNRDASELDQYHHAQELLRLAGYIAAPYLNKKYDWMAATGCGDRDIAQSVIEDFIGPATNQDYGLSTKASGIAAQVVEALISVAGGETPALYDVHPNDPRKPKKKPVTHARKLDAALSWAGWLNEFPDLVGKDKLNAEQAKTLAAEEFGLTLDKLLHHQKARAKIAKSSP